MKLRKAPDILPADPTAQVPSAAGQDAAEPFEELEMTLTDDVEVLRHTAYHEAGHAVIGRVLTLSCGSVTIEPDEDCSGHAVTHDLWKTVESWEARGKYRSSDSVYRGRIISFMAGAVAEEEILGVCNGGDDDDRYQVDMMLTDLLPADASVSEFAARFQNKTRGLVKRHAVAIERVAQELLERRLLTADDVDELIGPLF